MSRVSAQTMSLNGIKTDNVDTEAAQVARRVMSGALEMTGNETGNPAKLGTQDVYVQEARFFLFPNHSSQRVCPSTP